MTTAKGHEPSPDEGSCDCSICDAPKTPEEFELLKLARRMTAEKRCALVALARSYASGIGAALIILTGCAGVVVDTAPLAIEARDTTAIVEACGHQPIAGYSYCRVKEGDLATGDIYVHVPPGARSTATVLASNGGERLVLESTGDPIRFGWATILRATKFERSHRGFWIVVVRTALPTGDVIQEAEIRLRVLTPVEGYHSLHDSYAPSLCTWSWPLVVVPGGATRKGPVWGCLTSSGRSSVWQAGVSGD